MIESAYFGKPTIVGPMTQNFKDVVSIFLKSKALIQVKNADELLVAMRKLLANAKQAGAIGASAKRTIKQYQGATSKTIEAITGVLAQSQS